MTAEKRHATTDSGDIAYTARGSGPAALFVHGVFLNGYLWRHVIERVADLRRCLAIDLLAHGATRTPADADLSFTGQARMLAAFCDRLELDKVDLVANDSGGAIAQIFAAHNPQRVRSLTLTNCDAHDNWPPPAFDATRRAVAAGKLGDILLGMLADLSLARASFGVGYENPEQLSAQTVHEYIAPLAASPERIRNLERWFEASHDNSQTVSIEPLLRELRAPTQIVWGTGDHFFGVEWAHWLERTIGGATRVIELEGAKLFFPEERPAELARALREHWTAPSKPS